MSDISNCCRGWEVCRRIGALLEEEFFAQGDDEKLLKLPVMPLCNRETDSLAAGQSFWIPKIVLPTLQLFVPLFLGNAGDPLEKNCRLNQANWAKLVEKYGTISAGEIVLREYAYIVPKQPNHFNEQTDLNNYFDGLRKINGSAPADRVIPKKMPTARLAEPRTPAHCTSTASSEQVTVGSGRRKSMA
jgi:hypothetical protein